ncbi:alpha/beta hydrolase [Pseudonocardia sp. GCM10023141]|uniref:alpha/beta hydrolase n=1 Tax=Pseudonocardia sp. GCM10023141 TaxID=3252653 RepID=UPI0036074FEF
MSAPRGTRALVVALCSAAAVVVSCSQPTVAGAGGGAAPPDLQSFYSQKLSWGPCEPFALSENDKQAYADAKFDCAKLTVPLDYATPTGKTAQIGVLRQKATGQKIGSLLFNPGGPGGSGMSLVTSLSPGLAAGPLAQRFDLVGFDPRGVGASTPTIDCLNDAEWAVERTQDDVDPSPAGVAKTEQEAKDYDQHCVERSGGTEVLANVGTRDVVKDVDILRAVLGDQKLSYVGFSYGTRIGSEYAEAFPQNVRALVLDGALDPTETTIDRTVKQNAGFQQAFDAYAADCAKQANCPLGTDPAKATAAFQALSRPLIDKPLAVGNRSLSYSDAVTGTIQALYAKDFWPVLSRGISGLATGDGRILMALADLYYDRGQDGVYGNSNEAFVSISCVDEERITDRAVAKDLQEKANAAAPFRDSGRGAVAALDQCAFWPVPPTSQPHVPHPQGLPPTLVVSTTGDPATPYQAGVDLAKALGGGLITYEGTQHTVALQGKACVDDAVNAYLIDLKEPPAGLRCAA